MPNYQIEMLWTCRVCRSADNRGLHKHCTDCGKPKDERDEERFPEDISENNAITYAADVQVALAGPDWKCKYCDSLQNSLGKCCGECGCDRVSGAKPWEAKELSITENVETGAKKLGKPVTGRVVPRPNPRKTRIDVDPFRNVPKTEDLSPQHDATPAPSVQDLPAQAQEFIPDTGGYRDPPNIRVVPVPWRPPAWVPKLALSFAIAGLVFFVLWLIFRTRVVDVSVESVSWQHDVIIDRYQVFRRDGWDADPGAFEVHDEGRRIHHYDHVQVGSHQERYTERVTCGENCTTVRGSCSTTPRSCTSNKNGTATCTGGDRVCSPDTRSCSPKYCDEPRTRTVPDYEDQPRYRTWYSWKVWDWGHDRTIRASGASLDTRWPSDAELEPRRPLVDREQERSHREESYLVVFSDRKDTWSIRPKTEAEFQRFPPGTRFKIKVGIAHGVTILGANGTTTDY